VKAKKKAILGSLAAAILIMLFLLMRYTSWDNATFLPVTHGLRNTFAFAQEGITSIKVGIGGFFVCFADRERLAEEKSQLTREIVALKTKLYHLSEEEAENRRLRDLLEYKKETKDLYDFTLAKVIARDPGSWYKTLVLNRGHRDGLSKNMAVVTPDGLIGIIDRTTAYTSEVLLIIDAESAVGAKILENRVTTGIASGIGRADYMKMIHLPHDAPLEKGQTIVSSGLGGLYPEGLLIGTVSEIKIEPNGLIKSAFLEPAADFNSIEEVFVITQTKDPSTEPEE